VLDSRGRPTVEAEVELAAGATGVASVPSGASRGRHEAVELRDGDVRRHGGLGVTAAVENVRRVIAPALHGHDGLDQEGLDRTLVELDGTADKSRLGANALLAVSLAAARAAATLRRVPLWIHLGGEEARVLPLPLINLFSGGAHGERNIDVQDVQVVPVGASSYGEALVMGAAVRSAAAGLLAERGLSTLKADEGGFAPRVRTNADALDLAVDAIERAGLRPSSDVSLAVDVAATQLFEPDSGGYRLAGDELSVDADGMIDLLAGWLGAYPIVSLEDPLAEDDWAGWRGLTERLGGQVQVVGDDLFVTNLERLRRGRALDVANAVLIKLNQVGTLTETLAVVEEARDAGYAMIVSARSGETEDPFLADLAVATNAGQIKIGSLAQSERLAKYNQLLRIEEALGTEAVFAGATALARAASGAR
jgi:enolase